MERTFTIVREQERVVLICLNNITGLTRGQVFFRRNKDKSTDILQDFEYLDKIYLDSILDILSEEDTYDFSLLESKSTFIF